MSSTGRGVIANKHTTDVKYMCRWYRAEASLTVYLATPGACFHNQTGVILRTSARSSLNVLFHLRMLRMSV